MGCSSALAALLAEQRRAAAAVIAEPGRGVRLWLADWVAEELLIMEEAMSGTKTMGEVAWMQWWSGSRLGPPKPYSLDMDIWEPVAAAVIAAHEAQRPAWPAMRPVADYRLGDGEVLLLATDNAMRVMRFDDDFGLWVNRHGDTFVKPDQTLGWWPLPKAQR